MPAELERRAALLHVLTRRGRKRRDARQRERALYLLELRPSVRAWRALATVHLQLSKFCKSRRPQRKHHKRLAVAAFRRACREPEERLRLLRCLTRRNAKHPTAFLRLSEALLAAKPDEAADALRKHLDIASHRLHERPNADERTLRLALAKHLLYIATNETPETISKDYVASLFDRFSPTFESRLEHLNYQVPQMIMQALRYSGWDVGAAPRNMRILDLGAGTGLLGEQLRDSAPRAFLEGLDLSAAMLSQAEKKGCYDLLHRTDMCQFLEANDEVDYRLITAADVFVYVTSLERIFLLAHRRLVADGIFAFSVEKPKGFCNDYRLEGTGRVAHNAGYVTALAGTSGFEVLRQLDCELRSEGREPVRRTLCKFWQQGRCLQAAGSCSWAHGEWEIGTPVGSVGSSNEMRGDEESALKRPRLE
ncbi:Malonyl-[acyl-carrier protein] O-methyltransferase (Malonyl-ACP O-methyltransferase) (Biotin synthesis protein BioC) [Durusdinium trenchii]|uniref:Malonyl-[acyl-carrier protein] O-methyltransferase (Malonyl-ACP O-methyltransferase) (Biotin synthesis protein BioC) n=1 Tax=Durusdinium trenchii TaxID=1381693 RepID=A0ABP0MV46_9DINO